MRAPALPAPVSIGGDQEWEVDSILGHRYIGRYRTLQYHVLWRGFDLGHATWGASLPSCSCL